MGIGIRLAGFVLALALGVLGVFIIVMTWIPVVKTIPTYQWEKTDCHIEVGQINRGGSESPFEWTLEIFYSYTWKGAAFSSNQFSSWDRGYTDSSIAGQVLMRYTPGSVHDCYVNPQNPRQAVLELEPGWRLLMLVAGLVFGVFLTGSGFFVAHRANAKDEGNSQR
jgi:hypothetical protein